jgi:hypothetical protein
VRYGIPRRGDVQLFIYDLGGRLVRRLVDGVQDPGLYSLMWDGRNQERHRVASGVYFARLRADGRNLVRRLVVVR